MKRKIELLAPAGGLTQLVAAVENGADAVYLGGQLFNARINADNFTNLQLEKAIAYAHLRNVRIYITLNILLKDEELPEALKYAAELYSLGADGLILQDLGFAALVREYLPDFPLHLSTQGTVYNLSGVKAAKELGFCRVVLARELSINEMKEITAAGVCDIEVFVHGALCMCYSGQCQMSRVLGGGSKRSGNRGLCAQPCRLPYTDERGKTGYFLSPKDLCAIDFLGALAEAGVASFKIEGRMKSPEYVAIVVGIYRKYLDQYEEKGTYTVMKEDRQRLAQIFNRGGFTCGYLEGNPGKQLLSGKLSKHQGIYAGKVANVPRKQNLLDIKTEIPIKLGDGVEIRSKKLTGNVVTYHEELKNGLLRIGDIKGQVSAGDPVYRITSAALMKSAQETFSAGGPDGNKHKRKVKIDLAAEIRVGEPMRLCVREGRLEVQIKGEIVAERAISKPLSPQLVEKQLRKTGNTPFYVDHVELKMENGSSLPLSAINQVRREALDAFCAKKRNERPRISLPQHLSKTLVQPKKSLAFYFYEGKTINRFNFHQVLDFLELESAKAYVPLQDYMEAEMRQENITVIPYIRNISKGNLDRYIQNNFAEIVRRVADCGIAVGNLGWIREFRDAGVTVYADYGLNLYNGKAQEVLEKLGAVPICPSHEAHVLTNGPIPLMITEHKIDAKTLVDRRKERYKIICNNDQDKCMVIKENPEIDLRLQKLRWENNRGEMRIYVL